MLDSLSSFVVRFVFHHTRLYGWVPTAAWMLTNNPGRLFLMFYGLVRRSTQWRSFIHNLSKHGVKDSPSRVESRLTVPLKPASEKRYMHSIHPHGLLVDGWHIVIANDPGCFSPERSDIGGIPNFKLFLCFSPVIQYVPAHQEMYQDRCGASSFKAVENVLKTTDCIPSICPGGFGEAVYCTGEDKYEYSWLKGNSRFIALAIKNKTDIVPTYTYGLTSMYKTQPYFRQQLAEMAAKTQIPLALWWGKFLALPFHENCVTVVYDPFSVEKYSIDDVDQALLDYQAYLKRCFDEDKGKYGMGDKELLYVGPRDAKGPKSGIQSKL